MLAGRLEPTDPRHVRPGKTVVLGIDPSMTATGYGVLRTDDVVAYGSIKTKPQDPEPHRMGVICAGILGLIRDHGVTHVAMESFEHFYRSGDGFGKPSAHAELLAAAGLKAETGGSGGRTGRHNPRGPTAKDMFLMKAAQSSAQMASVLAGLPLFLYPVQEWKAAIVGRGANKQKALSVLKLLYRIEIRNHDAAEAILIAHHHLLQGRLQPERGFLPPGALHSKLLENLR
jgi:Holliday junction resolvasome RuvABC endonuclease subunit